MSKPIFQDLCINFDELLSYPDLARMLKVLDKQSQNKEAKRRTDPIKAPLYEESEKCPLYFGLGFEWLCFHFLVQYGKYFNISPLRMIMSIGSTEKDVGVDGEGITHAQIGKFVGPKPVPGSPVYLQMKATLNRTKEYTPNDGSRLGNFFAAAQCKAARSKMSYKARYVVMHSGSKLSYHFDNYAPTHEEINFKEISQKMDGDYGFLNYLRAQVGLHPILQPQCAEDEDAA
jgi:hypothetical protein